MGMRTDINRLATWIALLAILLAALMPAVSQAIAFKAAHAKPAHANAMHEICTADGIKLAAQPGHDERHQLPGEQAMHLEHCPYCLTNAASFALPPEALRLIVPAMAGMRLNPPLFYEAAHPLFAWAAAQPRAPPAHS